MVVGGEPVTEAYAQQIRAEGDSPDASRGVALTKSLVVN
jgi:methanogenic corrinoid protein MtbC1